LLIADEHQLTAMATIVIGGEEGLIRGEDLLIADEHSLTAVRTILIAGEEVSARADEVLISDKDHRHRHDQDPHRR
jgi:hypothetical protein